MEFLKNLFVQIKSQWGRLSTTQRVVFSAISAGTILFVGLIGWWSSRPQYIVVANSLSPTQSASLKSDLDAKNIPNKLNYGGSAILVPSARLNEARLVAGDDFTNSAPSFGSSGNSILPDPSESSLRFLRFKEESLASSLMRFKSIEWAGVQIAAPEPSPFLSDRAPTKASVTLKIRSGHVFTAQQAATVVALVSRSVDGLSPSNVSVLDTDGRLLVGPASGLSIMGQNFDHRRSLEADLAVKAERMLADLLGENKARVQVSAEIDFTERTSEAEVYDPDVKVTSKEEIISAKTVDPNAFPIGVAGVGSNSSPPNTGANSASPITDSETSKFEYLNGKTTETTKVAAGVIKRLTISAIVDLPDPTATPVSTDTPGANPTSPLTKAQIEAVVKNAVGFDAARGDAIEVAISPLAGAESLVIPETGNGWEHVNTLVANASLGIAAIVALILGMRLVKKIQPIAGTNSGNAAPADSARGRLLSELSEQAKQNPELVSSILSAWLNDGKDENDDSDDQTPDLRVVRAA